MEVWPSGKAQRLNRCEAERLREFESLYFRLGGTAWRPYLFWIQDFVGSTPITLTNVPSAHFLRASEGTRLCSLLGASALPKRSH
jgi:hypothetical protein